MWAKSQSLECGRLCKCQASNNHTRRVPSNASPWATSSQQTETTTTILAPSLHHHALRVFSGLSWRTKSLCLQPTLLHWGASKPSVEHHSLTTSESLNRWAVEQWLPHQKGVEYLLHLKPCSWKSSNRSFRWRDKTNQTVWFHCFG